MFHAIGNNPIFPDSFDYKNYYYYLKFEHNDKDYEIIRKGDSFIIQTDGALHMLDGISELKRYWTKKYLTYRNFNFKGNNIYQIWSCLFNCFSLVKMPKTYQPFLIRDITIKMI